MIVSTTEMMEELQTKSKFTPFLGHVIARSADLDSDYPQYKPGSTFLIGAVRSAIRKFFQLIYTAADALSGMESYFIQDAAKTESEFYLNIIGFLQKKGWVDSAGFIDERLNDAPHLPFFAILGKHSRNTTDGRANIEVYGGGAGKNATTAASQAIGEFLERYTTTIYRRAALTRSSAADLKRRGALYLNFKNLAGIPEAYGRNDWDKLFNSDTVFWWEKGRRWSSGERILIPAQLVYWNYLPDKNVNEPLIREKNTNGCGGFFTKEGAVLSGLYELIQRDALLVYWLNEVSPPRVIPESVPDKTFQEILEESKRYGFDIQCLNTTLDTGIPSFITVIRDLSAGGPYLMMGGGCGPDAALAARKALEEAWAGYLRLRLLASEKTSDAANRPGGKVTIGREERLRIWAKREMAGRENFFLKGELKPFSEFNFSYPRRFMSPKEELKTAISRVERLGSGYEVYACLMRNPILDRVGFYAARVIVPKFIPLYLNENNKPRASERLKEFAKKFGREGKPLNTLPHPFP